MEKACPQPRALTARDAAMSVAAYLAAEGVRLADHAGDPGYPSHYSADVRAVLAANHHRFRILSLNAKTPPAAEPDPRPSDDRMLRRLLATAIEDVVRCGFQAVQEWIRELAAAAARATVRATARTFLHSMVEGGTDETFLRLSSESNIGRTPGQNRLPRPAIANPASELEAIPAADGSDCAQRRPENIYVGQTGVFSCDWSWHFSNDGIDFPRFGYVGTLTGTWNGAAVFTCTRQVAESIVADQRERRAHEQATLQAAGVPETAARGQVDDAMPKLSLDGDIIVIDQRAMSGDPDAIEHTAPDENGHYEVGWGWGWQPVDPSSCHRIIGDLPPLHPDTPPD